MPSFVGSARLIGALTLLSRLLGMARDVLSSHFFGAAAVWDAFVIAYRVPNLFRRLFGEGALTAALVPAFVSRLETGRRDEAFLLLRRVATAVGLFLAAVVAVGIGATWLLPRDPKAQMVAEFLRIMLPYLLLICLAAVLGGALNGLRHFFAPAFAPVLLNIVWIAAIVVFRDARWVAWAIIAGGLLQLLTMVVALKARGVPLAPDATFSDPGLREVGARFAPIVLGLALVQVNELVDSVIAELCVPGDGAVSYLYYGNQLTQLPLSLIGTSVATALFPAMAAAAATAKPEELAGLVQKGLRGTVFLSVPATVGLVLFAHPIIELIYQHGAFTAAHTSHSASVLAFYALGLWCYCANQVQVRAFYARGDTKTPVRVSASMVALNLALNLTLVWPMGAAGIALSTSISGFLSFVFLQALLRRRLAVSYGPVARTLALSLVCSAVMGAAAWGVRHALPQHFHHAIRIGVPIAVALAVYFGLTRAIGMNETKQALRR